MKSNKSHLLRSRVRKMTKTEAAWLAGFFDGEGTIAESRTKGFRYWKLSVPNTSKKTIERVVAITGLNHVTIRKPQKKGHKVQWRWQTQAVLEVKDIAKQILPYVIVPKKAKRLNSALV